MSKTYAIALLLTLVLAGGYFYNLAEAVCDVPIHYRVGYIDERFDFTLDEALVAIENAVDVWEEATGQDLFAYDAKADFTINFIYDDRQQLAQAEIDLRERLDAAEGVNSAIGETYDELVARYDVLEIDYKAKLSAYEVRLAKYNSKVNSFNASGGAPPEEFAALEAEKDVLDQEIDVVNSLSRQLNSLVKEINRLSDQGNQLVEQYNEKVGTYNETFGESREFTQGDYQGDRINIYKFIDQIELELVLAHELGHALSLDHVENSESILYPTMDEQPADMILTQEDLDEFGRVCSRTTDSFIERLLIQLDL